MEPAVERRDSKDGIHSNTEDSEEVLDYNVMEENINLGSEIDEEYLKIRNERIETSQRDYPDGSCEDEVTEELLDPLIDQKNYEGSGNMIIEDGNDDILEKSKQPKAPAQDEKVAENHEFLIKKRKVDLITTEVMTHLVEELMMDGFVLRELLKLQGDQVKGIKTNINAVKSYLTELADFI